MNHSQLFDDAVKAATKLYNDTTVSLDKTLDSLTDLKEHVNDLISAIRSDLDVTDEIAGY